VKRNTVVEATIVAKYVAIAPVFDERTRRLWAATESRAIGYGGDALVSAATGLARETIRNGRRELALGVEATDRIRRAGAGRPRLEQTQAGIKEALENLVEPLTRGDPAVTPCRRCGGRARAKQSLPPR
jgi:CO/xanthine dehydrogenase Mo-binding subunit